MLLVNYQLLKGVVSGDLMKGSGKSSRRRVLLEVAMRVVGVYVAPLRTIYDIIEKPEFIGPLFIHAALASLSLASNLIIISKIQGDKSILAPLAPSFTFATVYSLTATALVWVVLSLLYYVNARLLGGSGSIKSLFSATGYTINITLIPISLELFLAYTAPSINIESWGFQTLIPQLHHKAPTLSTLINLERGHVIDLLDEWVYNYIYTYYTRILRTILSILTFILFAIVTRYAFNISWKRTIIAAIIIYFLGSIILSVITELIKIAVIIIGS